MDPQEKINGLWQAYLYQLEQAGYLADSPSILTRLRSVRWKEDGTLECRMSRRTTPEEYLQRHRFRAALPRSMS